MAAKRVSRKSTSQKKLNSFWLRAVLAVLFLLLAYVFASMAIDSGSLLQYAICLVLIYWAFAHVIRGIRFAIAH